MKKIKTIDIYLEINFSSYWKNVILFITQTRGWKKNENGIHAFHLQGCTNRIKNCPIIFLSSCSIDFGWFQHCFLSNSVERDRYARWSFTITFILYIFFTYAQNIQMVWYFQLYREYYNISAKVLYISISYILHSIQT